MRRKLVRILPLITGITLALTMFPTDYHSNVEEVNYQTEKVLVGIGVTPVGTSAQEISESIERTETFRVTAYCSCEKCCGQWASNRELDENGNPIVVGASGETLIANYSCASPLPFGTLVDLEGLGTYKVQDRTADWIVDEHGNNIIDIYMTDHNKAWNFGVQYVEGVIR